MPQILHIDSSPDDASSSYSRRLSTALVEALQRRHPKAQRIYRDLAHTPLPHIGAGLRVGWSTAPDLRTPEQNSVVSRCEGLIAELKAADEIVIGVPMHNFSVPSTLKVWIDHVLIAGQTFRYTPDGNAEGLLKGKRGYLALASGGVYSHGALATIDHLEPYLRSILAFIGVSELTTIRAEGLAFGPENATAALESARRAIAERLAEHGTRT
jgi:FMN-dependent NADH-azoreductase